VETTPQRVRYPDNVDSMSDMELLEFLRRPISVDEYNQMAEVGILGRNERVELLDGDVIVVPQKIIGGSMFWKNMLITAQLFSSVAIPLAIAGL